MSETDDLDLQFFQKMINVEAAGQGLIGPRQNLCLGFPTKQDSNQSPQLQRLVRKLEFRL